MVDLIKVEEKDKITVYFSTKAGKYYIKEINLHDKEPQRLLENAVKLVDDLNAGKTPQIASVPAPREANRPKDFRFVCGVCGRNEVRAFPDKPNTMLLPCAKCNKWTQHKQRLYEGGLK